LLTDHERRIRDLLKQLVTGEGDIAREATQRLLDVELQDDEYLRIAIQAASAETTLRYIEVGASLDELRDHYRWFEGMEREYERDRALTDESNRLYAILSDSTATDDEKAAAQSQLTALANNRFTEEPDAEERPSQRAE
jgi:hypothetical protein